MTTYLPKKYIMLSLELSGRQSQKTYQATQRWYGSYLRNGADPTILLDEAFSKSMGLGEAGVVTNLPRSVVKKVRNIFSAANDVPDRVMGKLEAG